MFLLWNHIANFFYEDKECGLRIVPKLTSENIMLTLYSITDVQFAVQILSSSVS